MSDRTSGNWLTYNLNRQVHKKTGTTRHEGLKLVRDQCKLTLEEVIPAKRLEPKEI